MVLLITVTLLTFITAFASTIISFIINLIPHDDESVKAIKSDITQLKDELKPISITNEFAKYVKLQRRINKLNEDLKDIITQKNVKIYKLKYILLFVTYGVTSLSLFSLIWLYKGEHVTILPAEWLWPLPNIFSWFSDFPGAVSISSWVLISLIASKIIARRF